MRAIAKWVVVAAAVAAGLAGCSTAPAAPSARLTVLFLGDSYTEGTALFSDERAARWPTVMSRDNGWVEVNAGCNGSGYVRPGTFCMDTYAERIPKLADTDPAIVIVSGGVNDLSYPADQIATGINATLDALVATFPDARIYAVNGIYYEGRRTPRAMTTLNDALKAAAERTGVTYLDIGDPLLGHPELMAYDGLHPNPDGHALIARLTQEAMAAAG